MSKRILIVQGHPTAGGGHYCHALADAYAAGAATGGHELRRIEVAELDFPLLRDRTDWHTGTPPPAIAAARDDLAWAEHIVVIFPLWLGDMPALLKGFFEQALRPGLAGTAPEDYTPFTRPLAGRSGRIVVTMGMPGLIYRWFFRAHALRLLKRNILGFVGLRPIRADVIGSVETMSAKRREAWLDQLNASGRRGR